MLNMFNDRSNKVLKIILTIVIIAIVVLFVFWAREAIKNYSILSESDEAVKKYENILNETNEESRDENR